MKKKALVSVLSVALVLCFAAGATIAWLKDQTQEVKNTFTVGDININLAETKDDFKMVPGREIDKDPKVTVEAGSEACWLFVTIEKSDNFDGFLNYEVADCWTFLEDGVYFYNGNDLNTLLTEDKTYSVLKDDKVYVRDTVTKDALNSIATSSDGDIRPTLTFKAYAVQKDYLTGADGSAVTTAADAWALAQ